MRLFLILMSIIFFLKYASAIKGVKYRDEWIESSHGAYRNWDEWKGSSHNVYRNANRMKPLKFVRKV